MLSRPQRPEDGFTLVELLLSVALLGIITGALTSAMLVMLGTKQRSEEMLAVSRDRQFVANYFTDDAAGARAMAVGSQPVCGATVHAVVVFSGKDTDPGTTSQADTTVAWVYEPARRELARTACRSGGSPDVRVVARNVAATPTVSGSCSSSVALSSTPAPRQVALSVPQAHGGPLNLCALRRPL